MNISSATDRALSRLGSLLDSPTFTWNSSEVPCVPNSSTVGSTIIIGGVEESVALVLFVKRSEFLTVDTTLLTIDSDLYTADNARPRPVSGRTLVYLGRTYKILSAREDASRTFYTLTLQDSKR